MESATLRGIMIIKEECYSNTERTAVKLANSVFKNKKQLLNLIKYIKIAVLYPLCTFCFKSCEICKAAARDCEAFIYNPPRRHVIRANS